jgi:uncharacterized protein with ATP-grasp and redox domains
MGRNIHRHIQRLTGERDPYLKLKERFNRHAMDLLPELRKEIQAAPDPFELAVRLAVAGNTIDFGTNIEVSENLLNTVLSRARKEVFLGSIPALKQAVEEADSILYLADNTGEIALDHLLLDQLPLEKVVFAVRGAPIINDATLEDALFTGITERVETIDTGSDVPGILLSECCEEFRQAFEEADLIIAKGQGNFETLNTDPSGKIFFLLMAKCHVVARDLNTQVGTFVSLAQTDLPLWNFEQPRVI